VRKWAKYAATSPLYLHLSEVIAADGELMRVLNRIEHTPEPNVLLAGVQFLMAREGGGPLGAHYPNFAGGEAPIEGVARPFKAFVLAHEDELVEIGRTRYTQTNECRRCVALLPVIWMTGTGRFHLIDLGTGGIGSAQPWRLPRPWTSSWLRVTCSSSSAPHWMTCPATKPWW
jgi:hypothetical protein